MGKYEVEIQETLIYKIEVEADSKEQAEEVAFASHEFSENQFVENDAVATVVTELE